jgi:hypothetical protein
MEYNIVFKFINYKYTFLKYNKSLIYRMNVNPKRDIYNYIYNRL